MTRRFIDNLNEDGSVQALPLDTYNVEVIDARAVEKNDQIPKTFFMDLRVIGGPDDGKVTSVSLYVPDDGERGAQYHFNRKARGLIPALRQVSEANVADDDFVVALADAVIGLQFEAKLGIQSGGAYDGNQELLESRPISGVTPAPTPPANEATPPAETNEASPAPAANDATPVAVGSGGDDAPPF